MSGFIGGGNNNTPTKYTGLQIQTSAQGVPIALLWGTKRMGTNLIWSGDFVATPDGGKKGGKGGDGKGGGIFNYSTAIIMGLCEGAGASFSNISIRTVWADKVITSLAELGLTLFTGTATQSPWAYMVSEHPNQALSYAYTAYLANSSYQLGKSPNLPNHTFEVSRFGGGGNPWNFPAVLDANMAWVIYDFTTNPQYSIGLKTSQIDFSTVQVLYSNYIQAYGLWMSPSIETQEQISSILDRWATLTNAWIFWSGNVVKIIPLGDQTIPNGNTVTRSIPTTVPLDPGPYQVQIVFVTTDGGVVYQESGAALTAVGGTPGPGQYRFDALNYRWIFNAADTGKAVIVTGTFVFGGVGYTPNTTITFDLNYDNLVTEAGVPPIDVNRADPADLPNRVRLQFKNRNNAYNADVAEWRDDGLVGRYGIIDHPVTQADEICDPGVAYIVAQLMGQRAAYVRNTYEFTMNWWMGSFSEPGDLVTLTDPHIPLSLFTVRIRTLEEDENGNWKVLAEENTGTVGDPSGTPTVYVPINTTVDPNVDPGSVNPPAVFEPNSSLTNGVAQLWVAASGGKDWGGCIVFASFDGTNYTNIGSISQSAAQGVLTAGLASHADPDNTNTLSIDTTESQVALSNDATHADADAFRTLSIIQAAYSPPSLPSSSECISYGAVSITGTYTDNITYLRRGLYGTSPGAHVTGDFFTRLDLSKTTAPGNSVLVWDLPAQYIGVPIHLKFASFNRFANKLQDLSAATAYSYTPTGVGYGGGTAGAPTTPTGLAATPGYGSVALAWNPNPLTDNVQKYNVYRAPGLSQPFGSATLLASTTTPGYTDNGLGASTGWTYFVKAVNAAGVSAATAGVNATVLAGGAGTVTSVGLSDASGTPIYTISGTPVTGAGTLTMTLQTQSANKVFAGPTSGGAAQPTFRSVVPADFATQSANTVLAGPTSGGAAAPTFRAIGATDLPALRYDLSTFYPGVPGNSQLILRWQAPRSVTIPSGATNSQASSGTAATGSTTFTIKQNGSSVGTIVWSASGTTGAFTVSSTINIAAGDVITITGPATADATIADIAITLAATA